jgi:ribosomal protein L11 methyltransferase
MLQKKGFSQYMAYYEFTIRIPETFKDTLIQRLSDAGCLGMIENDEDLVAYFPESIDVVDVRTDLSILKALLVKCKRSQQMTYDYALIPDQDWNETWKRDFKPVDVGERFTILPPWEEKKTGRINLYIDPAMAFGTGHHETTRSCLALMEKYSGKSGFNSFLDLGTGTGILAIAASKLGYRHVVGVDTDPLAVDAAGKNIQENAAPTVIIMEGSLSDLKETFDVIAANLISGVLVRIASELAACMNPGGIAILSGILFGQEDEVIAVMEREGLMLREKYRDKKWVSLVVEQGKQA